MSEHGRPVGKYRDAAGDLEADLREQWSGNPARKDGVDVRSLWFVLRAHFTILLVVALATFMVAAIVNKFVLNRSYQATALLRCESPQSQASNLFSAGDSSAGAIGALAGLGEDDEKQAQEYISILTSYAFTMQLVRANGLTPQLLKDEFEFGAVSDYDIYEITQDRFDCDFDLKTGNLVLTFIDPNPREAERILGLYIDSLRKQLREREVRRSNAAIGVLTKEASGSSDSELQKRLYELVAIQIEKRDIASVQSDFAFKLIEPPISPDRKYRPRTLLNSSIAAMLALAIAAALIFLRSELHHSNAA